MLYLLIQHILSIFYKYIRPEQSFFPHIAQMNDASVILDIIKKKWSLIKWWRVLGIIHYIAWAGRSFKWHNTRTEIVIKRIKSKPCTYLDLDRPVREESACKGPRTRVCLLFSRTRRRPVWTKREQGVNGKIWIFFLKPEPDLCSTSESSKYLKLSFDCDRKL